MITVDDLSLQYSGAPLFSKVNLQFTPRQLLRHHRRKRRRKIHIPEDPLRSARAELRRRAYRSQGANVCAQAGSDDV